MYKKQIIGVGNIHYTCTTQTYTYIVYIHNIPCALTEIFL